MADQPEGGSGFDASAISDGSVAESGLAHLHRSQLRSQRSRLE